jgi:glycosyltransferase involved in cell wall biosynthesis
LDQDCRDLELIVVDDASKDNSGEVAKSFTDPRIRYFRNLSNLGIARNMNKCLSLAGGKYVILLNSDDLLLPGFLRKACDMLDSNPSVGFVHSAFKVIDEDGHVLRTHRIADTDSIEDGRQVLKRLIWNNFVMISSVLFRRDVIEHLGRFDESYSYVPDWEMLTRICINHDVGYLSAPLACYRVHPNNLTRNLLSTGELYVEGYRAIDLVLSRNPPGRDFEILKKSSDRIKANYVLNHLSDSIMLRRIPETRSSAIEALSFYPPSVIDLRFLLAIFATFLGETGSRAIMGSLKKHFPGVLS